MLGLLPGLAVLERRSYFSQYSAKRHIARWAMSRHLGSKTSVREYLFSA